MDAGLPSHKVQRLPRPVRGFLFHAPPSSSSPIRRGPRSPGRRAISLRSSLASDGSAPSQGQAIGDALGASRRFGKWSPYFIPAEDRSALFPRSPFLSTDLRFQSLVRRFMANGLVQDRSKGSKSFAECAVGAEIFEFLLCSAQCDTREQAQRVCQRLQDKQLLWHVQGSSSAFDPSESAWYGVRTDVDDITPSDGSSGSSGEEVGPEAGPGGAGSSPTAKASKQDATAGTAPASRHLSVGGGARPRRPSAAKELDALILRDELRNPPLKTGFLAKQGHRVRTWRRRWFELRPTTLAYFRKQADEEPAGVIDLRRFFLHEYTGTRSDRCFLLVHQDQQRYYLCEADNDHDFRAWRAAIAQAQAPHLKADL